MLMMVEQLIVGVVRGSLLDHCEVFLASLSHWTYSGVFLEPFQTSPITIECFKLC